MATKIVMPNCTSKARCRFWHSVGCVRVRDHPSSISDRNILHAKLWRDFFSDPFQWWDNRAEKVNPKYPDFKHKRSGIGLWLDNSFTPPWVEAELATIALGILQPDNFSWNARLRRYLKAADYKNTLSLFQQMQQEGRMPDKFTFVAVLNACSHLGSLQEGRRVHEQISQIGCATDIYVENCLVDMYAKCGCMEDAWSVFDKMPQRTVVSWNAIIGGYVKSDQGRKALELFQEMQQDGVEPDSVTFIGALNACASVAAFDEGRRVHQQIVRRGCKSDVYVANCLVDMYVKCGSTEDAWSVFNEIRERSVVSWTAMIVGYVKSEQGWKALELFQEMQREGVEADSFTFVAALNACASVVALEEGRRVHKQIIRRGCQSDVYVANCLVDMYARCGCIKDARTVFKTMRERDVVSWSTMIGGYAMHGHSKKAIELFQRMSKEGLAINHITLTCLLSACSRGGLVKEGLRYFNTMTSHYNILLTREHYACMVDLLGRAGWLQEAEKMTKTMPMKGNSSVWRSLLGACRIHGNIKIAELAAKRCWELDPGDTSSHVLLSKVYAAAGKWDMSTAIEKEMSISNVWKEPETEVNIAMHSLDEEEHPQTTANPMSPLLGASRIHGNFKIAELAAKRCWELDPGDASSHVPLSKVYAAASKWDRTTAIEKEMSIRNVWREPD